MFTPALCGDSGKTATLDTKQNIRKMSSGKRKRSKSVEDILDGDASGSPLSKAIQLLSPMRIRSFSDLLRAEKDQGLNTKTFGVPLEKLCDASMDGVPKLVVKVTQYVEDHGLDYEGIYRVNPNMRIIDQLRAQFDKTGDANFSDADVASVAGLLKMFLRDLPTPLLPKEMMKDIAQSSQGDKGMDVKLLANLVTRLSRMKYNLLKYLIRHLHIVSRHEKENKMTPANLAIVFGPNIFSLEGMEYLYWQKYTLEFLCVLISKYKEIFSEVHKGNLEGRPAYPIPYKEYMAEKNIYEPVTFSVCHDYPTAAKEEEEEVFGAPVNVEHLEQNGQLYALVNKPKVKSLPHSLDGCSEYQEVNIDKVVALSPTRVLMPEEQPRTPSPWSQRSTPSPTESPKLTPRTAQVLNDLIKETVSELLFDPLKYGTSVESPATPVEPRQESITCDEKHRNESHKVALPVPSLPVVNLKSDQTAHSSSAAKRSYNRDSVKSANRRSGAYFGENLNVLEVQEDVDFDEESDLVSKRSLEVRSKEEIDGKDSIKSPKKKEVQSFEKDSISVKLADSLSGNTALSTVANSSSQAIYEEIDGPLSPDRSLENGHDDIFDEITIHTAKLKSLTKHRVKPARCHLRLSKKVGNGGIAGSIATVPQESVLKESEAANSQPQQPDISTTALDRRAAGKVNGDPVKELEKIIERILKVLQEKRKKSQRPANLDLMSWEDLQDEKKCVQLAILQFEKQHSRPKTREGKDIMRPLYERYRDIKKKLSDGKAAHESNMLRTLSPPAKIQSTDVLDGSLGNITLAQSLPVGSTSEYKSSVVTDTMLSTKDAPPTGWDNAYSSSDPAFRTLGELLEERTELLERKKTLRKRIQEFEKKFQIKHGRAVQREDRNFILSDYQEYKQVKKRLQKLEDIAPLQLQQSV